MLDLYGLCEEATAERTKTRPAAVEQLRRMLVVALAAEWQGFARDLFYDGVEAVTATIARHEIEPVAEMIWMSLTRRRRLDRGNADQSALSEDFRQIGLYELWSRLDERTTDGRELRGVLTDVMNARNAVAHGSESQMNVLEREGVTIDVGAVRRWHDSLDRLAAMLDIIVTDHVDTLVGEETG